MTGFVRNGDCEAGVGGDVEGRAAGDCFGLFGIVENVAAAAADDFHQFGRFGAEVIFARKNDAECFG